MNDKTILRIHVPAHLYESVKAKLTLKEGKGDMSGGAYTETVKEKKASAAPKAKAETAPKADTPDTETKEKKAPKKEAKYDVDKLKEFKSMLEMLIGKMEEDKKGSEEGESEEEVEEKDEE